MSMDLEDSHDRSRCLMRIEDMVMTMTRKFATRERVVVREDALVTDWEV